MTRHCSRSLDDCFALPQDFCEREHLRLLFVEVANDSGDHHVGRLLDHLLLVGHFAFAASSPASTALESLP